MGVGMIMVGGATFIAVRRSSDRRRQCLIVDRCGRPLPPVPGFPVEGVDSALLVPARLAHRLRKYGGLVVVYDVARKGSEKRTANAHDRKDPKLGAGGYNKHLLRSSC